MNTVYACGVCGKQSVDMDVITKCEKSHGVLDYQAEVGLDIYKEHLQEILSIIAMVTNEHPNNDEIDEILHNGCYTDQYDYEGSEYEAFSFQLLEYMKSQNLKLSSNYTLFYNNLKLTIKIGIDYIGPFSTPSSVEIRYYIDNNKTGFDDFVEAMFLEETKSSRIRDICTEIIDNMPDNISVSDIIEYLNATY